MKAKNNFIRNIFLSIIAVFSFAFLGVLPARVDASSATQINGYSGNGEYYSYIEFGRYPQSLIEGEEAIIINSLLASLHQDIYADSLSNCLVEDFFPTSSLQRTYNIDGINYTISFDSSTNYYTLDTKIGNLNEGTQFFTYNQAVDSIYKSSFNDGNDATIYPLGSPSEITIDDTSIGYIYLSNSTQRYNDGNIYLYKVEPVNWRVLYKEEDIATLQSTFVLDSSNWYSGEYNNTRTDDFANSGLMQFISSSFGEYGMYNRLFNSDEIPAILGSRISECGGIIDDYIYIGGKFDSAGEYADTYSGLTESNNAKSKATDFAIRTGSEVDVEQYTQYWLRSYNTSSSNYVGNDGSVYTADNFSTKGIKPIIRVNLNEIAIDETSNIASSLDVSPTFDTPVDLTTVAPASSDNVALLENCNTSISTLSDTAKITVTYAQDVYKIEYSSMPVGGYLVSLYSYQGSQSISPLTTVLTSSSGVTYIEKHPTGQQEFYYIYDDDIYLFGSAVEYPILYVSSTGSDDNDGVSPLAPIQYLKTAINRAIDNQEIMVMNTLTKEEIFGVYNNWNTVNTRYLNDSSKTIVIKRDFNNGPLFNFVVGSTDYVSIYFNSTNSKLIFEDAQETDNSSSLINITGRTGRTVNFYFSNVTASGFNTSENGAIINANGYSNIRLQRGCIFENNVTTLNGGVICATNNAAVYFGSDSVNTESFMKNNRATCGGAIYLDGGSLNLGYGSAYARTQTSLLNNEAQSGGAIYVNSGSMSVYVNGNYCYINNNKATSGDGGAIYSNSNITASGSSNMNEYFYIDNNSATGNGGGIYLKGSYNSSGIGSIMNLNSNSATNGGAIYIDGDVNSSDYKTISYIRAYYNTSSNSGGAIYCKGNLNLQNSSICYSNYHLENNVGQLNDDSITINGGGVYVNGDMRSVSSNYQINYASNNGGGIYTTKSLVFSGSNGYASGNVAGNFGGGVYASRSINVDTLNTNFYFVFQSSTWKGTTYYNQAKRGGAVYISDTGTTQLELNNINFSGRSSEKGGALYIGNHPELTLKNCVAQNCQGIEGGFLYLNNSLHIINDGAGYSASAYASNSASSMGGVFHVTGNITFESQSSITLQSNTSQNKGGAIYAEGDINMKISRGISFSSNTSSDKGGAIYCKGNITIERLANSTTESNVEFRGNRASFDGGAVYCEKDFVRRTDQNYSLLFNSNCVTSNGSGGALYVEGDCSIDNLKCSSNYTYSGNGGAIYAEGDLTINDEYLTSGNLEWNNNRALNGGAIYCKGDLKIYDNGNAYAKHYYQFSNNYAYYNGQDTTMGNADVIYVEGASYISSAFFDQGNNGGARYNSDIRLSYVPQCGGAIYAVGDCILNNVTIKDFNAIYGGAIYAENYLELRTDERLDETCPIYNNTATYGGCIWCNGDLRITSSSQTNHYVFYSNNVTQWRSGYLSRPALDEKSVAYYVENDAYIEGVSITELRALYVVGNCTTKNATFANSSKPGDGGAIYALGDITIIGSTFNNCRSTSGSGGAIYGGGDCYIQSSTFNTCSTNSNNSAYKGGAIYLSKDDASIVIEDSTFINNESNSGGAVSFKNSATIKNSIFSGNRAYPSGSIVYVDGTMTDVLITFIDCQILANESLNTASPSSGLVCFQANNSHYVDFIGCEVKDNINKFGAVIKVMDYMTVTAIDSVFVGNRNDSTTAGAYNVNSSFLGGAFIVYPNGQLMIDGIDTNRYSVISNNYVVDGGEGASIYVVDGGVLSISNTYIGACAEANIEGYNLPSDSNTHIIYSQKTNNNFNLTNVKAFNNNLGFGSLIYLQGDVKIDKSIFENNTSSSPLVTILSGNTLTLLSSVFRNNSGDSLFLIDAKDSSKIISFNNIFEGNDLYCAINLDTRTVSSFDKTKFISNVTTAGRLVYISSLALCSFSNSQFSFNSAKSQEVEGLCIKNNGTLTLSGCLFEENNEDNQSIIGGAIYSSGEGNNLIINSLTINNSNICGAQIYVEPIGGLEIKNLTLSQCASGIFVKGENVILNIIDSSFIDNDFVAPVLSLACSGVVSLTGSSFKNNKLDNCSILEINNSNVSLNVDNCNIESNDVSNHELLSLNDVENVKITRTYVGKNSIQDANSAIYIKSKLIEIAEVDISDNDILDSNYLLHLSPISNCELVDISIYENTGNNNAVCLNIVENNPNAYVLLDNVFIFDNQIMGFKTSGSGKINVEQTLLIDRKAQLDDSACLVLKKDALCTMPDLSLGERSKILLDGMVDPASQIVISSSVNDVVISSYLSNTIISLEYISPFKMKDSRYSLSLSSEQNSVYVVERGDVVTQDVVRSIATNGYTESYYTLVASDFIVSISLVDYDLYYKTHENDDYVATSPSFNRAGQYDVYYKIVGETVYEGQIKVVLTPKSLQLKSAPTINIGYNSPISSAVFTSYQVVNDEGVSVSGIWSFDDDISRENATDNTKIYSVTFTPYNTSLYGTSTISTTIMLNIYFDKLYYTGDGFSLTSNGSNIDGFDTLSSALEYVSDYGTIYFSATYVVSGRENICVTRSVYLAQNLSSDPMIKIEIGGILQLAGSTGKIIIDGNSALVRNPNSIIVNNGNLSLNSNVIIRNFKTTTANNSTIINNNTLILDGCKIYSCFSQIGGAITNSGVVILSSGEFYDNNAQNMGGFIYNKESGEIFLNGGLLYGNSASYGSAIASNGGSVYLNSGAIRFNLSTNGGTVYINCGNLYLGEVSFVGNRTGENESGILLTDSASIVKVANTSSGVVFEPFQDVASEVTRLNNSWDRYLLILLILLFLTFVLCFIFVKTENKPFKKI